MRRKPLEAGAFDVRGAWEQHKLSAPATDGRRVPGGDVRHAWALRAKLAGLGLRPVEEAGLPADCKPVEQAKTLTAGFDSQAGLLKNILFP
jgi:hypothetical protein